MTDQLTEPLPGSPDTAPEAPDAEAPSGPIRVSWASVPRVNLLPVEVVESRAFRRTQLVLGGLVGAAVVIAAAGLLWAQSGVSEANAELTNAQATVTAAQAEQARYATVPQVISQVDAAGKARTEAMADDVLWYRDLTDLAGALPAGVALTNITGTLTSSSTSQAASSTATDPLTPAGIGTMTLTGTASTYPLVSTWINDLNKINGVASAKLNSATKDTSNGTITFSITATVTSDALSGRYTQKAG